jgi:hypothetical protein
MISPLGQRQLLQTLAVETVRQALEGGVQAQREQARRQAFDAKLAEAMEDVTDISESEALLLSGQETPGQEGRNPHGTGAAEDLPGDGMEEAQADGAEPHLDLLA